MEGSGNGGGGSRNLNRQLAVDAVMTGIVGLTCSVGFEFGECIRVLGHASLMLKNRPWAGRLWGGGQPTGERRTIQGMQRVHCFETSTCSACSPEHGDQVRGSSQRLAEITFRHKQAPSNAL